MAGLMDAMGGMGGGMGGGMMPPQAGPEAGGGMPQPGPQEDQLMQIVMMAQQILGRPPRDLQEAVEAVFQQGQQAPAPTGGQGTAPPPMPPGGEMQPGMPPQGMMPQQGMQAPMGFSPMPPMMRGR